MSAHQIEGIGERVPRDRARKRGPVAPFYHGITGGGTCSLEIAVQEHVGVEKKPHGLEHMLGGQSSQTRVIAHISLGEQPSLARPLLHERPGSRCLRGGR